MVSLVGATCCRVCGAGGTSLGGAGGTITGGVGGTGGTITGGTGGTMTGGTGGTITGGVGGVGRNVGGTGITVVRAGGAGDCGDAAATRFPSPIRDTAMPKAVSVARTAVTGSA
ncbi:hypothetical protein F0L68_00900 [Solihabitans fulvus]|uniref:Uncharacterized protein n=1 Tax=Solihabitans fulvus TaxID=1892852 RepID=A0A5B2XW62_9PSEU|nr:hypothetical protein [Solihabitans fulvus]KAA2267122.1 hypothetical protein F0L68_00900 [Solihabitans fulvus]